MPVPINPYYSDGQPIKASDLQQVKQAVDNALAKTSKTFTWQNFPSNPQGAFITFDAIDELKRATDLAYDSMNPGCAHDAVDTSYDSVDSQRSGYDGYYSYDSSDDSVDSYDSVKSHDSGYYSNNAIDSLYTYDSAYNKT